MCWGSPDIGKDLIKICCYQTPGHRCHRIPVLIWNCSSIMEIFSHKKHLELQHVWYKYIIDTQVNCWLMFFVSTRQVIMFSFLHFMATTAYRYTVIHKNSLVASLFNTSLDWSTSQDLMNWKTFYHCFLLKFIFRLN